MPDKASLPLDQLNPVLTAAEMREADRLTIESFGMPGFTLMESAGRAAAGVIVHRYGIDPGKPIVFLCGKGNNGGDGLVVARVLHAMGARVHVYVLGEKEEMSAAAANNLELLVKIASEVRGNRIRIDKIENALRLSEGEPVHLYVDALLGTGLEKDLREPIRGIVDWLNERAEPVVALDIPTGLHSDTGKALGTAVRADVTVTMAALKAGLLINEGVDCAGEVEVVEIGIPRFLINRVMTDGGKGGTYSITDEALSACIPRRDRRVHKYSVGLALVVGGSQGFTGAPVMASTAAARVGAGAVVCACQERVQPLLAGKMTEVMTLALPESSGNGIDSQRAMETIEPRLRQARALLVGCGLGRNPDTAEFVRNLVARAGLPLVIDADGLNALSGHMDIVEKHAGGNWILTPHAGEFERLVGEKIDLGDPIGVARAYAARWNCVLVLKGMPSLVARPDGTVVIGSEYNAALATAGTGDVLAGLCVGLLAQGVDPFSAACVAVHLGGKAARRYTSHLSLQSMMAMDLLDELPLVLKDLVGV